MIGQLLAGHYNPVQVLGAGGFGKTYIAEDQHLPGNPKCVVKHLSPASNDPFVLETARRLFQKEAETLQKLGNHDQIPRLLAYFEENQEFYLVQELINGENLGKELLGGQKWTESKVIEMLIEVLNILRFVHSQGVIHRDIKPDNIIRRTEDKTLVLIDFGAIKQLRNQSVMTGSQASISVAIGTPGYMPTEQSRGKPRPSSDIYALGMIGIQALTGVYPHELEEDSHTGEILWKHLVSVSAGLVAILETMTRYHFKDRYQTADEALIALQNYNLQILNPKVKAADPTLPIPSIPNSLPATIPVAPVNPLPSSLTPQPVSSSTRKLPVPLLVGMSVAVVSITGVLVLFQNNFFGFFRVTSGDSVPTTSQESCFAVVNGNIRSTPASSQNNLISSASGEKFEVTGRQTSGGWIEVKLADGTLGWVYRYKVISNNKEMNTCINKNQISIQTVEDITRTEAVSPEPQQQNEPNTEAAQLTPNTETTEETPNTETTTETTEETLNTETTTDTDETIDCSTDNYSIKVTGNDSSGYTYTAYEKNGSQSQPSLVLTGSKESRRLGYVYTFNNGEYSYTVSKISPGRGGQIYLGVYKSGQEIRTEQCQ